MIIGKKRYPESLPACLGIAKSVYPDCEKSLHDFNTLTRIELMMLEHHDEIFRDDYTCYIEKKALEKFLTHANNIYSKYRNEATGVFVGYYLHSPEDASKKVAVAVDFLPSDKGTSVTCEISHKDAVRNALFCEKHKMLVVAWPHTHPFNRPLFYSSVDSDTLRTDFSAPHQMGIVCDNLSLDYMGFKIVDGQEVHQSIYVFDLDKTLFKNVFVSKCLYESPLNISHKKKDDPEAPKNSGISGSSRISRGPRSHECGCQRDDLLNLGNR